MRKNRLNDLDSKSYMKFLKSWCLKEETLWNDFIYFFTKQHNNDGITNKVAIWGFSADQQKQLGATCRQITDLSKDRNLDDFSYALINLQKTSFCNIKDTHNFFSETIKPLLFTLKKSLRQKAYLTILMQNTTENGAFFPLAWITAKWVSQYFEMKDEKLVCLQQKSSGLNHVSLEGETVTYALNFRNTFADLSSEAAELAFRQSTSNNNQLKKWFVLKPPQRKENVKLHPAKFPEVLITYLIESYSRPGDNIFDPMSGTGSTQVAALECGRNAYGCEITEHFYKIALDRLGAIDAPGCQYALVNDDAYNFDKHQELDKNYDYMVTSPPYWDMLNMKGAETQKNRQAKGLRINYSELDTDLGNCADYDEFLNKLLKIYDKTLTRLKAGGYFTIIVKNIKKKGTIYTFAWDLVEHLGQNYEFVYEQFWLQDDIRIAPYGWGSAWVSNTFHHYILTFKK